MGDEYDLMKWARGLVESQNQNPVTGVNYSDQNTTSGLEQEKNRQQAPILDQTERGLAQQLIAQKQAYETAETDADRQRASDMANLFREMGLSTGKDLSDYGADRTLQQARAALANNDFRATNQILNDYNLTPDEYYDKNFADIRAQGIPFERAVEEAGRRASEYQANRRAALSQGYNMYGVNPDGVINQLGVQILGNMLAGNPEKQAQVLGNAYATPKNVYDNETRLANELTKIGVLNNNTLQRMVENYNFGQQAADNQAMRDFNGWKAKQDYVRQNTPGLEERLRETFEAYFNLGTAIGLSPEDAVKFASAQVGYTQGNTGSDTPKEFLPFAGTFTMIDSYIGDESFGEATQALQTLKENILEGKMKDFYSLDAGTQKDTIKRINIYERYLNAVANKSVTPELQKEFDALHNRNKNSSTEISKNPPDPDNNMHRRNEMHNKDEKKSETTQKWNFPTGGVPNYDLLSQFNLTKNNH